MKKLTLYFFLLTCQVGLSQFSSESFNDVEVDFETEEIVSDDSLIEQKTELLKKINSSLLDLNQYKSERLNKIEKRKKRYEKLGQPYTTEQEEKNNIDESIKNERLKYSLLLYMIEFSQVNFIDVKWAKGFLGGCKIVLIGEDGKMYGGTNWIGKGLSFNTIMECKTKIKNKELQETKIGGSIVVGKNSSFNSKNYDREFTPKWFLNQHITNYSDNEQGYIDYKFGDF